SAQESGNEMLDDRAADSSGNRISRTRPAARTSRSASDRADNPMPQPREFHVVTQRQIKQSWRYLRDMVGTGPRVDLDVAATLRRFTEQGMFGDLVLRPRRVNRAAVVLLIDWGGSMVPFHDLARQFLDSVQSGGGLAGTNVYYFHDCPTDTLAFDPR